MRTDSAAAEWGDYQVHLADRVRSARINANLSQGRLAELAGLHRNQVSNIERNTSSGGRGVDPHLSTLFRLAMVLGLGVDALLPPT